MSDKINFYTLLELDHLVSIDEQKEFIEKTIRMKELKWSKYANEEDPHKELRAKLGLRYVPIMLHTLNSKKKEDEELWRNYANQIEMKVNATEVEAQKLYRDFCDIYGKRSLSENLLPKLNKLFGDERDARTILGSLGVTVIATADKPQIKAPVLGLRKTTLRKIERLLENLGHEDLYTFLSNESDTKYSEHSNLKDLLTCCRKIVEKARKGNSRDPLNQLRGDLGGQGLIAFKDKSNKKKYDAARKISTLENLISVFGEIGYIEPCQLNTLIGKFAHIVGTDETTTRAYISNQLNNFNITQIEDADGPNHVALCPYCGQFNDKSAKICIKCASLTNQTCFNCGDSYAAELTRCPSCRTTITDGLEAQATLAEAHLHLETRDLTKAIEAIRHATSLAPKSRTVSKISTLVTQEIKETEARLQDIENLINRKQMHAAAAAIRKYSAIIGLNNQRSLGSRIQSALKSVASLITQGEQALVDNNPDSAYDFFTRANRIIIDDPIIKKGLSSVSPSRPVRAIATLQATTIRINWEASATRIANLEYLVVRSPKTKPVLPTDGQIIYEGPVPSFRDNSCPVGVPVFYGVFSKAGIGVSKQPAVTSLVFRTAPVNNLQATPREASITLDWDLPSHAVDAAVYRLPAGSRSTVIAKKYPDGTGRTSWLDDKPNHHASSTYVVVARFKLSNTGAPQTGEPVTIESRIILRPSRPERIAINSLQSDEIRQLSWSPPKNAAEVDEVLIFDKAIKISETEIYQESSLPKPIARMPVTIAGSHPVRMDYFGTIWAIVARSRGSVFTCGTPVKITSQPALKRLKAQQVGQSNVKITWDWPPGCPKAKLKIKTNTGHIENHDIHCAPNRAPVITVAIEQDTTEIKITALAASADDKIHSQPISKAINIRRMVIMTYRLEEAPKSFWGQKTKGIRSQLYLQFNEPTPPPAIIVRFHPNHIPPSDLKTSDPLLEEIYHGPTSKTRSAINEQKLDLSGSINGRRGYINITIANPEEKKVFEIVPLGGMNGARTY